MEDAQEISGILMDYGKVMKDSDYKKILELVMKLVKPKNNPTHNTQYLSELARKDSIISHLEYQKRISKQKIYKLEKKVDKFELEKYIRKNIGSKKFNYLSRPEKQKVIDSYRESPYYWLT